MIGVLGDDRRMRDVVAAGLASGKLVSGHAAGLTGSELQAYLASGIDSDTRSSCRATCLPAFAPGSPSS